MSAPADEAAVVSAPDDEAALDDIVSAISELSTRPLDELNALLQAHEAQQHELLERVTRERKSLATLTWCDDFSRVRTAMLKLPEYKAKVGHDRGRTHVERFASVMRRSHL